MPSGAGRPPSIGACEGWFFGGGKKWSEVVSGSIVEMLWMDGHGSRKAGRLGCGIGIGLRSSSSRLCGYWY